MQYEAKQIEVLTGLEPVRKRPGMYTNTDSPNHLVQEVIDNSVDEAIAGFADFIKVTLHQDSSISIEDNGRGMPVDIHPEYKISGIELILTYLHSGGKFSNKAYKFSGGLHGVGVSVVNALSKKLLVEVKREGKIWQMEFNNGEKVSELKATGVCSKKQTGTTIRFYPDEKFFDTNEFSQTKLSHLLRAKAVLCSGLKIEFFIEKTQELKTWQFDGGVKEYLLSSADLSNALPKDGFIHNATLDEFELSMALIWDLEGEALIQESFVNLIPTLAGGTHTNGLRTGLLEAVRKFCDLHNLLPRGLKFSAEDIWQGLNFILSLKMQEPQFAGQTKERLSSRQAATFVATNVEDAFLLWLNQDIETAKNLINLFVENANKRLKQTKLTKRKKIVSGPALPGKLSDCTTSDSLAGELFLVEGDSAGGSAKQARDRNYQAILPLRGKILNTWEVNREDLFSNQEIEDISIALGVDPGSSDLSGLRYGKVCILADADSDGLHIATLLCALFFKHFHALIEAGHIFVAMPPLYRLDAGKNTYYALDDAEKEAITKKILAKQSNAKISTVRFKGLGEMNPSQLRETTMQPDTRRLVQLVVDDAKQTSELMDMLLAKKRSGDRKSWLEDKGDLISEEASI